MIQIIYWFTGYTGSFPVDAAVAQYAAYELMVECVCIWGIAIVGTIQQRRRQ